MEGGIERRVELWEPSEVTHVKLSIFRHGDKEKPKEGQSADRVLLSEKGRAQATDASDPDRNVRQSLSFGSVKERSRQTAAFRMAGHESDITGDESLEALETKFDTALKEEGYGMGKKIGTDSRLDFELDPSSEYGKALYAAFSEGRYLRFLIDESDALAKAVGDTENSTYSSQASGIADLVLKYVNVSRNWDRIYRKDHTPEKENPKGYTETLERLLGTHQGIGESFLAEVIKRTEGEERRDTFVESLGNQGFGDVEGFELDISRREGEDPEIRITFNKDYEKDGESKSFSFDREVPTDMIEEIAQMDRR